MGKNEKESGKKGVKGGQKKVSKEAFEDLNILGLTEVEEKIIVGLLELGPTSVNKLSRQIFVPHTTIHYAIRKLKEQGLVKRVSKGYRSVWEVVKPEKIQEELKDALTTLTPYPTVGEIEDKIGVKVSEKDDFFTIEGLEDILKTYQWMFLNHRNQHICGIQTVESSEAMLQSLDPEAIEALDALLKQNKVILETVLPEAAKSFYARILARNKAILGSFAGEGAKTTVLPNQFLNFQADVLVAEDVTLITNWKAEVLVLVRNQDFIDLIRNLFEVLKEFGKPLDQNSFLP